LKEKEVEARELDGQVMALKNAMREMQLSFSDDYQELEMNLQKAMLQLEIASENEGGAVLAEKRIKSLETELEAFAEAAEIDHENMNFVVSDLEDDLAKCMAQLKESSLSYDRTVDRSRGRVETGQIEG
jgi:hypothetical protein